VLWKIAFKTYIKILLNYIVISSGSGQHYCDEAVSTLKIFSNKFVMKRPLVLRPSLQASVCCAAEVPEHTVSSSG
jgi:hypothetical protein